MRQIYMAAVVPTMDYAAATWYAPSRIGVKRHVVALKRVQRLASKLILRAYKSVAMLVLQSEAKLLSVSERIHERVSNHLIKLCSLAPYHPLQRCISWFPRQGSAFSSPLRAVYEKYEVQVEPEPGLRISERLSWVMPPWQSGRAGHVLGAGRSSAALSLASIPGCLPVLRGFGDTGWAIWRSGNYQVPDDDRHGQATSDGEGFHVLSHQR